GSGSRDAGSHKSRLDAISALANCMNSANLQLSHVYRPDDNSGTTEFLRSALGISDFCNNDGGQKHSRGPLNTSNGDSDPIRAQCVSLPGSAATPCRSDGTLGLVVAISENDPGFSSIDATIARRIGGDNQRTSVGYTSRAGKYGPGNNIGVR